MISCTRITSVEYYEQAEEVAKVEGGQPDRHAGRDEVAYYQDDGATDGRGVWWTRTVDDMPPESRKAALPGALPPSQLSPLLLPPSSPFGENGTAVSGRHIRDLAAGRHPKTKEVIVDASATKKRSVGFDIQISAPKSFSGYVGLVGDNERPALLEAHDRAMRRALDFTFDNGLIVARRSVDGKTKPVPAAAVSAAVYRHHTSRAKDPHVHSHAVLTNVAVRDDGSTGALDNAKILQYGGAIAALYRTELASILRDEFGIETVQKGRNFEIAGFPEEVIATFSKRRKDVEKAMPDGKSTAGNRAAAQVASYETRADKDRDTPLAELELRWQQEARDKGWPPEALLRSVEIESRRLRAEREAAGKSQDDHLDGIARQALERTMTMTAVVDDRLLMRDLLEAMQTECVGGADEALRCIDRLKTSGFLIEVGRVKDERPVYSTQAVVDTERRMLKSALTRKGERRRFDPALVEAAIAARPTMRKDQAEAVRHALNDDGVSIVQGYAGSGKSFSMGTVAEVARKSGFEVYTIAPSWKATDVIRQDTATDTDHAFAVPGFLERVERGLRARAGEAVEGETIDMPRDALVILDEAGMVGQADMARLVDLSERAGFKLVASGDTKQLQPVTAGSPMSSLERALGSVTLGEIQRQRVDWQRAASQLFPAGRADEAMQEYEKHGHVRMEEDREALIANLARDYCDDRARNPQKTRTILSGWNVDVRAVNDAVREIGKAEGWIGAEDTTLSVIPRGSKTGQAVEIGFAPGDEVIFGETLKLDARTVRNADIARLDRIEGEGNAARLTFTFRDGGTVTATMADLTGYREEGQAKAPKLQHASAMTTNAAQGVTVDHAYVANLRGMGRESAYVSMTRHRDDVTMYVDRSRLEDHVLSANALSEIKARKGGTTTLPEEEDDKKTTLKEAELAEKVRATLFAECKRSDAQANASDFHENIEDFIEGRPARPEPTPVPEVVAQPSDPSFRDPTTAGRGRVASLAARMQARLASPVAMPVPAAVVTAETPPAPVAQASTGTGRDPLAAGRQRPRPPIPSKPAEPRNPLARLKPVREAKGRITDDEKDQMVRTDLLAFACQDLGGTLVERWGGGGAVRFGDAKSGEKIGITQKGAVWTWTVSNDTSTSGTIIGLVQHVRGMSWAEAAHWLRERLGTWRPSNDPIPVQKVERQATAEGDPAKVREAWMTRFPKGDAVSRYLVEERGLRPDILRRFGADIKADWTGELAHNRFGAGFAHRTPDGDLVSYVRRGPARPGQVASFRAAAAGGSPTLFMAGDRTPDRIMVTESAIDTLSLYQHDGAPAKAMLLAPDGTPGRRSLDAMAEIARRNPDAEWHVGLDNDEEGQRFAAQVREAIRKGNPAATIRDRSPEAEFKDWNGRIRNVTAEQEKAVKAERARQVEAERLEAERRAAEEAERRRRQEIEPVAAPRPGGPRM